MKDKKMYDVIIIGGSFAGLSAALSLGRSLRNTLIIDSGKPCNRYAEHSQNFLTHDGVSPAEILKTAKKQLAIYETVEITDDFALSGLRFEGHFEIKTDKGKIYSSKCLIFASGIKDLLPVIEGFSDCWGKSVVHCPYCHGYELKNKKTGILANGERAFQFAQLAWNLTKDLTIYTQGLANFSKAQIKALEKNNIPIVEKEITALKHSSGQLEALEFVDGSKVDLNVLYTFVPFEQNSKIPQFLGCEVKEDGYLKVDNFFGTNVSGIYACGDCISPMRSVANAVFNGNFVGAVVNKELAAEEF